MAACRVGVSPAYHLGEIYAFRLEYTIDVRDLGEGWRASRARAGGGCLLDMGYHAVDLIHWLFGRTISSDCRLSDRARPGQAYDVEDTCLISTTHSHGPIGSILISRCAPPERETLVAYGTTGFVSCDGESVDLRTVGKRERRSFSKAQQNVRPISHFLGTLRGDETPVTSWQEQFDNQEFIETCYRSAVAKGFGTLEEENTNVIQMA